MIKKILAWITGKSDTVAAAAPYKVEVAATPSKEEPEPGSFAGIVAAAQKAEAAGIDKATVVTQVLEVKAKFKKSDLEEYTKGDLIALAASRGIKIKSRALKEDIIKVLLKA